MIATRHFGPPLTLKDLACQLTADRAPGHPAKSEAIQPVEEFLVVWACHDDLLDIFLEDAKPSIRSLQFLAGPLPPPHSANARR